MLVAALHRSVGDASAVGGAGMLAGGGGAPGRHFSGKWVAVWATCIRMRRASSGVRREEVTTDPKHAAATGGRAARPPTFPGTGRPNPKLRANTHVPICILPPPGALGQGHD